MGNFFPVADKNMIPMNGLLGEFPPSEREFIGHDRELNHRNRELAGNAGPPPHDAHEFPNIDKIIRGNPDGIMAAFRSVSKP